LRASRCKENAGGIKENAGRAGKIVGGCREKGGGVREMGGGGEEKGGGLTFIRILGAIALKEQNAKAPGETLGMTHTKDASPEGAG
jgi:hypothetical protein